MPGQTRSRILSIPAALLLIFASFTALAQIKFDLPAQPLAQALTAVGSLAKLNIYFDAPTVDGIQAPALKAELSPDDALARLLAGTRLHAVRVDEDTIRVVAVSPPPKDAQRPHEPNTGATHTPAPVHLASANPGGGSEASLTSANDSSSSAPDRVLPEVLVTAEKREERLHDVPISITAVSGADLERSSVQGVTEALTRIPGVVASMGAEGAGTQIGIRGVGAGGPLLDGSSPIGYYLDSVPFSLVRSGIAPDANIFDLNRIEVLRGPQGTLYGSSAENGVVRVLTNDADLNAFDVKARVSGSDTDSGGGNYRGDAAINVPLIEGKLAIRGVVGYENDSGWINTLYGTNVNSSTEKTYRLKINAQPTDQLSAGLSLWSSRYNADSPSTSDANLRADHPTPDPLWTYYDTYNLKLGYETPWFSVSSSTSYLDYDNAFTLDLAAFGAPGFISFSDTTSHMYSEELLLNSTDNDSDWRWSAGSFYRNAGDRFFETSPAVGFGDTSESYAIFGELSRRFLDRQLEFTVGLRYFHDDVATTKLLTTPNPYSAEDSFHATTPRAILTWYPSRDFTLYGSYSEGFRSGMPQYYTIAQTDPSLAPLKPDKLHNYELGAKLDFLDKRLSLDGALYYIDWRDVQQAVLVPFGGVEINALTNGNTASGPGLDLSVITRPLRGLNLGADFSWNDLTFDSNVYSAGAILFNKGDRLNFSSAYTGGVFSDYDFPLGPTGLDGMLSVSANYTSKQSNRGTGYLAEGDNITLVRASFTLSSSAQHWSAMLFADNLNNSRAAYPAAYTVSYWYPRPRPRTIGLQLEYHLK